MRVPSRLVLLGILGIACGAVVPDADHLFKGQARTWGHDWRIFAVVYGGCLIAYLCRSTWAGILKSSQSEPEGLFSRSGAADNNPDATI